jgi:hypothetical protein
MNLREAVSQLSALPEATFICARRPWGPASEVRLVPFPEDLRIPEEVKEAGFEYFLEVSTALEILEGFLPHKPTPEQVTNFVIYYAENDAFPEDTP